MLSRVLITGELFKRTVRASDPGSEARALGDLVTAVSHDPASAQEHIAEVARSLCHAGSAGISLLDGDTVRWKAVSGALAVQNGRAMTRGATPCGLALDRDTLLLLREAGQHFEGLADLAPPLVETLVVPWRVDSIIAGTIWVASHEPHRRFDVEDARVLGVLASLQALCAIAIATRNGSGLRAAETALRSSEERFRLIVDSARDYAILTMTPDGVIDSWFRGAEAVFGWSAAEAIGQSVDMTFTPEDRARGEPQRERAITRERNFAPDVRWHVCRDGKRVFIEGSVHALHDASGGLRGFVKIGQDVTRRRALDAALAASEARYRTLVENIYDYAIFLLDADGNVSEWAAGAQRLKGYTAPEVLGRHVSMFYTPEDIAFGELDREMAEARSAGRAEREGWSVRKGGDRFWVNEIMTSVRDADGRQVGFTKISRDLTEQRLAEEVGARVRAEEERTALRRLLTNAEEEERRRLARELHDQLGQQLTAITLGLDEAERLARQSLGAAPAGGGPEKLFSRMSELRGLARDIVQGARNLALELRPPELDDVGLVSAVRTYVAGWGERYGVQSDVTLTGSEETVPMDVGSTVYRIVQESLTNVAKHAGASEVSVLLDIREDELRLVVEDDGRGFDVDRARADARREGRLGLAGMNERAALLGGSLVIESVPGSGTSVFVRLPLPRRD